MADVTVDIGGHSYTIACRDGEEPHLRKIAALVGQKAAEATQSLGSVSEVRQLLFASLLLADELDEAKAGNTSQTQPAPVPQISPILADAAEQIAARIEALATRLEKSATSA